MSKLIDLKGEIYGRLKVESFAGGNKNNHATWKCICECGNKIIVVSQSLRNGHTKSCGCLQLEVQKECNKTHGKCGTREYRAWYHAKQRCTNPKNEKFKDYGGRGIIMCDRWLNSFENFFEDMGEKPSKEYSIDRIDVNGNYTPENCKWSTPIEQGRNKRRNRFLTYNGETKMLAEWARILNIGRNTIYARLRYGWTIEAALGTFVSQ